MKDECEFLRKVELVINRQGPRPDDPAVAPPAGGSSDRVTDRRAFISGATLGLLAAPLLAAEAQQAKTNRIGVLTVSSTEPFRQNLRQLGYVEGQNIVFDVRETQGSPEL